MKKDLVVEVVGVFFDPKTIELKATLCLKLDKQQYNREINISQFFRERLNKNEK